MIGTAVTFPVMVGQPYQVGASSADGSISTTHACPVPHGWRGYSPYVLRSQSVTHVTSKMGAGWSLNDRWRAARHTYPENRL